MNVFGFQVCPSSFSRSISTLLPGYAENPRLRVGPHCCPCFAPCSQAFGAPCRVMKSVSCTFTKIVPALGDLRTIPRWEHTRQSVLTHVATTQTLLYPRVPCQTFVFIVGDEQSKSTNCCGNERKGSCGAIPLRSVPGSGGGATLPGRPVSTRRAPVTRAPCPLRHRTDSIPRRVLRGTSATLRRRRARPSPLQHPGQDGEKNIDM